MSDLNPTGSSTVTELVERSNRLGADPKNTNYAGGNTSAKGTGTDPVTGEDVELLWVKGSGGDLGTLTESGLAVLRLDRFRSLVNVYPGVDREDEMVAAFDYCLHGKGGAAPSIDTAMHGLVDAAQVLELPGGGEAGDPMSVVVVGDRGARFGLVVEEFLGERDLEVRPLDPRLNKPPDVNSASVLDDGWPVLIVDVEDLVRSIDNLLGGKRLKGIAGPSPAASKARKAIKRILVVDDSITVRELERQLLESRGYAVDVAVDGPAGSAGLR